MARSGTDRLSILLGRKHKKRKSKKRGKKSAQKVMRKGRKGKIDLVRPEAIITSHYTTIEICLPS